MTSKRQKENGFTIPDPYDPEGRLCVQFQIPDAPEYRQAIIGHLYQLAKWWVWEKSYLPDDTRARDVAELFRGILQATLTIGENCGTNLMFQLRQNSENHCLLEQSVDGGVSWTTAFNYSLCGGQGAEYIRFDEDGNMEVSYDGGSTWTPATGAEDPRIAPPMYPPIPGMDGDTKRCIAARNAAGNMKIEVNKTIADAAAWGGITALTGALLGLLFIALSVGSAGTLTPLLIAAAAAILSAGSAGLDAAFTSGVWDTFLCILYCNFKTDGTIDEGGFQAVKLEVEFQLTGIASTHLINMLNLIGYQGLNNLARLDQSEITGSCETCGGCGCDAGCTSPPAGGGTFTLDFIVNNTTNPTAISGGTSWHSYGSYGTCYGVDLSFTVDLGTDVCVSGIKLWGGGSSARGWSAGYKVYGDGGQFIGEYTGNLNNALQTLTWTANETGMIIPATNKTTRHLYFEARPGYTGSGSISDGYAIKRVEVRGCT